MKIPPLPPIALFAFALVFSPLRSGAEITLDGAGSFVAAQAFAVSDGDSDEHPLPDKNQSDFPTALTLSAAAMRPHASASATGTSNADLTLNVAADTLDLTASSSAEASASATGTEANSLGRAAGEGTTVEFVITDRSYTYTLTGSITGDHTLSGNSNFVSILGFTGGNHEIFKIQGEDFVSTPFSDSGTLPPGRYRISFLCATSVEAVAPGVPSPSLKSEIVGGHFTLKPASPEILWKGASGGSFDTASKWSPHTVPSVTDTALFGLPGAYTVRIGTQATEALKITRGSPRFITADYTVGTGAPGTTMSVTGNGSLTLAGGTLRAIGAVLGGDFFSPGDVHVEVDAHWEVAGRLEVGAAGEGHLFINGGVVSSGNAGIGASLERGFATVTGSAGRWDTGPLALGDLKRGELSITSGGTVSSGAVRVGDGSTVLVTGLGRAGFPSKWTMDSLEMGGHGSALMEVRDGAVVKVNAGEARLAAKQGAATLKVGGTAPFEPTSFTVALALSVGFGGPGVLEIGRGGAVSSVDMFVGFGSTGIVTIRRGTLHVGSIGGGLFVGSSTSTGTLRISDGGQLTDDASVKIDGFLTLVTVAGNGGAQPSTLDTAASIFIQGGATFAVLPGAMVHAGVAVSVSSDSTLTGRDRLTTPQIITVPSPAPAPAFEVADEPTPAQRAEKTFERAAAAAPLLGGRIVTPLLTNDGTLIPGGSDGPLTIEGDFVQTATGRIVAEVGGTRAGKTHDQLQVTGTATLAGTVVLQFMNGFAPEGGQKFSFLDVKGAQTGDFTVIDVQGLAPGAQFQTALVGGIYTATALNHATALPTVSIRAAKHAFERRLKTGAFVVSRKTAGTADLAVNYRIGGTAESGADYEPLSGSVVIPAGKKTAKIIVTPLDDDLIEGRETIELTVLPSLASTHSLRSKARIVIVDDEHAPR